MNDLASNPRSARDAEQAKGLRIILLLIVVAFAGVSLFYVFVGQLIEDEGWYLYAGKLVFQGQKPYVDFAYTQAPPLPYIFGLPQIFAGGGGVYAGRITAMVFSVLSLLLAMKVASRLSGNSGAVGAGLAMIASPAALKLLIEAKTYSLTGFLLVLAVFFLTLPTSKRIRYLGTAAVLVIAAGVRLSTIIAVPLLLGYLLLVERERRYLWEVGVLCVLGLGALFVLFVLPAPEAFQYHVLSFHTASYALASLRDIVISKVDLLSGVAQHFFLVFAVLLWGILLLFPSVRSIGLLLLSRGRNAAMIAFLAILLGGLVLANFLPWGAHWDYDVIGLPIGAVLVGATLSAIAAHISARNRYAVASVAGALILVAWLGTGREGISISGGRLPITRLAEVADFVRAHTTDEQEILTFHTYVAVQASRRVPDGMEMGIFSYYPDWDTAKARRYHVVNDELLHTYLQSQKVGAVVITGPFKGAGASTLDDVLQREYQLAKTAEYFGQLESPVYVYLRRS